MANVPVDFDPFAASSTSVDDLLPMIRQAEGSADNAVSPAGAVGRYQIMPATAKALGFDPMRLKDPVYNEQVARAAVQDLIQQHGQDTKAILAGYNASPKAVTRWKQAGRDDSVLPKETQNYFQRAGLIPTAAGTTAESKAAPIAGRGVPVDFDPFQAQPATPVGAQWGPGAELSNALFLGFGPEVAGYSYAMRGGQGGYEAGRQAAQGARAQYAAENPLMTAGLDIVGALPATVGAAMATPELAGLGALRATGVLGRAGANVIQGSLLGGEAGGLQTRLTGGSLGQNIVTGAELGGVLGTAGEAAKLALTPRINPAVAATAQRASQLGVNISPEQLAIAGSPQATQFGAAALRLAGGTPAMAPGGLITGTTMQAVRQNLQSKMNALVTASNVQQDRPFMAALLGLETRARGIADEAASREALRNVQQVRSFLSSGDRYQELTNSGSNLDSLLHSKNATARKLGADLREEMDDLIERNNPGIGAEWKETRQQWKNSLILQKLAEDAQPSGVLDPTKMHSQVKQFYSQYGWEPPSDIMALAEAGRLLPKTTVQGGVAGHKPTGLWPFVQGGVAGGLGALALEKGAELLPQLVTDPRTAAVAALAAAGVAGARTLRASGLAEAAGQPIPTWINLLGATGRAGAVGVTNKLGGTGQ